MITDARAYLLEGVSSSNHIISAQPEVAMVGKEFMREAVLKLGPHS